MNSINNENFSYEKDESHNRNIHERLCIINIFLDPIEKCTIKYNDNNNSNNSNRNNKYNDYDDEEELIPGDLILLHCDSWNCG